MSITIIVALFIGFHLMGFILVGLKLDLSVYKLPQEKMG